jgi:7,8-dihydropterin-6-yl-methyl-4-(beta-D-ribofuranosyl)aminobenzene 5'-phosphate synthase
LRHAQRLTGVEKVHAFVGGLHLTGALFEAIIPRTIDALVAIGSDVVVPGYCTGWAAISAEQCGHAAALCCGPRAVEQVM